MKEIAQYIFSANEGYFIDLKDAKLAVTITPNEHDIIFHEGTPADEEEKNSDRWNGLSVSGKSVIGFDLGRFRGATAVYLLFNRDSKTETHLIGTIDESEDSEDTAIVWINRVNKFYI